MGLQLEKYIAQLVRLNTPVKGVTLRKALEGARKSAIKQGKSKEDIALRFNDLTPIELISGSEYLIWIFDALSRTRERGTSGPEPIKHTEAKAYFDLTGEFPEPWEYDMLMLMDRAFIDAAMKIRAVQSTVKKNKGAPEWTS